jgi:hypothetical protein
LALPLKVREVSHPDRFLVLGLDAVVANYPEPIQFREDEVSPTLPRAMKIRYEIKTELAEKRPKEMAPECRFVVEAIV